MSESDTLLLNLNLTQLFEPILKEVVQDQSVQISNNSYVYLLNLLESYGLTYVSSKPEASEEEKMLSERLLLALQMGERYKKEKSLKNVGETALFKVGFFGSSLKRKIAGVKFHIDIGRSAYSHLFSSTNEPTFEEISEMFPRYADILSGVQSRVHMSQKKQADLIELFDWYQATGSEEAKDKLVEEGVPLSQIKKASNQ